MTYNPDKDPTRAELEAAWRVLVAADVRVISDVSLAEYGRIVRGNPDYAPDRYSPAEIRFAGAIIALRAELQPHIGKSAEVTPKPFDAMAAQIVEWGERVGKLERELEAQRRIAEAHFRELCRVEKLLNDERAKAGQFSASHVAGEVTP